MRKYVKNTIFNVSSLNTILQPSAIVLLRVKPRLGLLARDKVGIKLVRIAALSERGVNRLTVLAILGGI